LFIPIGEGGEIKLFSASVNVKSISPFDR